MDVLAFAENWSALWLVPYREEKGCLLTVNVFYILKDVRALSSPENNKRGREMKYEAMPKLLLRLCFIKLCAPKILSATMKCDFTKCYYLITQRMQK